MIEVASDPDFQLEAARARADARLEAVRLALQAADQQVSSADCDSVLTYARRIAAFVEGRE